MSSKNRENKPKLVIILGPTASGKTDLAIKLAKKYNGEIVNADSRQIYIGLDIGTAKYPRQKVKGKRQNYGGVGRIIVDGVPIYLVDILEPTRMMTAAEYKKLAEEKIDDIVTRGKLPILCGGTMLYLDMIAGNFQIPNKGPDQKIREELATESLEELVLELKRLDKKAAKLVDLKNRRRVERALEVALLGGSITQGKKLIPKYQILKLGITRPREELYERIDKRVGQMLDEGLFEEAKAIYKKYGLEVLEQTIGYKEVIADKNFPIIAKLDRPAIEKTIQKNTRNYAKRQMTWWRRDEEIVWVGDYQEADRAIKRFLG